MQKYLILLLLFLIYPLKAESQESVVFLHGFCRNIRCMIPLAHSVRKEGHNVYLWDYPSRKKTIEGHAEALVELLNRIAKQNPNEPIHFISHSLGGVIVRTAVCHPNCPYEAKIGRAILLAPPNRGSTLARNFQGCPIFRWIFGKKAGHQLLTYKEEDMYALGEFPESKQVMVIAGTKENFIFKMLKEPNDGKVTVEETKLNTPHTHHVINVGHGWIMTSRESIGLTKRFLFSGSDQPPAATPPPTPASKQKTLD